MLKIHERFIYSLENIKLPDDLSSTDFRILKHVLNSADKLQCIDEETASKVCEHFKVSCEKEIFIEVLVRSTSHLCRYHHGGDLTLNRLPLNDSVFYDLFCYGIEDENYKNHLQLAVEKSAPLLIRLYMCFDVFDEQLNKHLLKILVSGTCLSSLRAFINLPLIIHDGCETPSVSKKMVRLLSSEYDKSLTLLMIACKKNNYDVVVLLSKFVDINQSVIGCHTASDHADSLKILIFLLENDSKFPLNFAKLYPNNLGGTEMENRRIRDIVNERTEFHIAIENGRAEDVIQSFREKNPDLMFAYRYVETTMATVSQSALLTSLSKTKDDFATVYLLYKNGFHFNKVELNTNKKCELLKGVLNRLCEEQSSHIHFLLGKCKIIPGKGQSYLECHNKLKQMLDKIDDSDVGAILKLIEYSDSLSIIVVDFYNKHVTINPYADDGFEGYTEHHTGHMFVNAKQTFADVLVHECCHLALYILFKNACEPYYDFDDDSKQKFRNIVDIVRERLRGDREKSEEELILSQTYDCYGNEADWPKELIARVPQLIVMGRTQFLKSNYGKLLDFFKTKVLCLMRSATKNAEDLRIKIEVDKLNDFLRHFKEIGKRVESGVWTNTNKFVKKAERIRHIECKWIRLYLADIYKTMIESMKRNEMPTTFYILSCVEDFVCSDRRRRIKAICERSTSITLIIFCENENEKHLKELEFIKTISPVKFVTVGVNELVKQQFDFNVKVFCETATYTWDDIDAESRKQLFKISANFQGHPFAVGELVDNNTALIPLERLVNGADIVIENRKPEIDHYDLKLYVERKFDRYESVDCALSLINKLCLLLIGNSGSGKSIVLAYSEMKIKEKYPDYWVTRKSLRELAQYLRDNLTIEEFLKLCVNPSDKDFQEKLLIAFYHKKMVILLLDAADELEKNYDAFLKLLKILNGNVQLFLTSQSHLSEDLQKCLPDAVVLKLIPFSQADQVDCVYKIWSSKCEIMRCEEKLKASSEDVVSLFLESIDASAENIGLPLITKMLAELCADDDFTFKYQYTGIFELIVNFLKKMNRRITKEKGEETVQQFGDSMTKDINYQYGCLALKYLFRYQSQCRFSFNDKTFKATLAQIDLNYLQRSGLILVIDGNKYIFDHDIFAMAYVANFVVKSLRSKENEDKTTRDFSVAMDVLLTSSMPTLLKFIDGAFRMHWQYIDKQKRVVYDYFGEIEVEKMENLKNPEPEDDDDDGTDEETYRYKYFYTMFKYIENDAYFVAAFLVNRIPIKFRWHLEENLDPLFDMPHKFLSFFLAAILMTNNTKIARKILTSTYKCSGSKNQIFQHIFLRFPSDILDAVTDTKDVDDLKEMMYRPKLSMTPTPINQRFEKSILKLLTKKANECLNKNEIEKLLQPYSEHQSRWNSKIGEDYFEDSLDMKLRAMKELDYPFTNWLDLMTNTLLVGVIRRIFMDEKSNQFIIRFYRWAHMVAEKKTYPNMHDFKKAVSVTFARHFWSVSKSYDATGFLHFIRSTMGINITTLINDHANEIVPVFTKSWDQALHVCHKYLEPELVRLVTINTDNGENVLSEYINKVNKYGIREIIKLLENSDLDVEALKLQLNASKSSTLCSWLYSSVNNIYLEDSIQHWCLEKMFAVIEDLLSLENLKKAIQFKCDFGTSFHAAAKLRDLFVLEKVWRLAHRYLSEGELGRLLLETNENGLSILHHNDPKILTEPPSICNIFECATFEFIPFVGNAIPTHSVGHRKTYFIGRLRNSSTNEDELYEIVFHEKEKRYGATLIMKEGVYDGGREGKTLENLTGMTILTGNGFQWAEVTDTHVNDARRHCFTYNRHYISFVDGHITFVQHPSVNQLMLLFNDVIWENCDCKECIYKLPPESRPPSRHSSYTDVTWSSQGISPASVCSDASSDERFDLDELDSP